MKQWLCLHPFLMRLSCNRNISIFPSYSKLFFSILGKLPLCCLVIAATYCLEIKLQWICLFPRDSQCCALK